MLKYIKSELLKHKHRFYLNLMWLSPLITVILVLLLMNGDHFMIGSFNWWYVIMLPGIYPMIIAFNISEEKKYNRHGLLSVVIDKKKLWLAQLLVNTFYLFITNILLFFIVVILGKFLNISIPLFKGLMGSLTLFITFAWQTPFIMVISEKTGTFFAITTSLFCNIFLGLFAATKSFWYIPFAITPRLMCPIIKVLPNGLPLENTNPLADPSVITSGIFITIILFIVLTFISTLWFKKMEV